MTALVLNGADILDAVNLRIPWRLAGLNGVAMDALQGDARDSRPFPGNHFDGLMSLELLEHVGDWKPCVGQMCIVVRPGGHPAISTPAIRTGVKAVCAA